MAGTRNILTYAHAYILIQKYMQRLYNIFVQMYKHAYIHTYFYGEKIVRMIIQFHGYGLLADMQTDDSQTGRQSARETTAAAVADGRVGVIAMSPCRKHLPCCFIIFLFSFSFFAAVFIIIIIYFISSFLFRFRIGSHGIVDILCHSRKLLFAQYRYLI